MDNHCPCDILGVMYFPKNYRNDVALELAALVVCAYDQFNSFSENRSWQLPEEYTLLCELKYSWSRQSAIDKTLPLLEGRKKIQIPIGFIARKKNDMYVIFRGTKTAKEWINNFNTKLNSFVIPGFGNVHAGFHDSYVSFRDQIDDALTGVKKNARIHIAGHSLGAAFATFALCDIECSMNKKVEALYTFGSPRVGDKTFVQKFNARFAGKTFRIANTSDIITQTPLPVPVAHILGGYFTHVDTPIVFTEQNEDLELNHKIGTYLTYLSTLQKTDVFYKRLFRKFS